MTMNATVEALKPTPPPSKRMSNVLIGGALGGVIDFLFATISAVRGGAAWTRPWMGVAGGLFGKDALQGGAEMAILGIVLHFSICVVAALVLYFVVRQVKWLPRHWFVLGILHGIALLAVMNYVILPLSAIGRGIYPLANLHVTAFFHILLVGWPTAFFVSRALRGERE